MRHPLHMPVHRDFVRAALLLAALSAPDVRAAQPFELVRAGAEESSVRADGAIAYVERHDGGARLAVLATDGSVRTLDARGTPDTPAWSPAGNALAYATMEGENSNLVVLDLATGESRHVAATSDSEMHPFWSPRGERLVYTRLGTGPGGEPALHLFETDLRPGGAEVALLGGAEASYGSWSPSGEWLLFWHFAGEGNAEIAVARGDGSMRRELTADPAFDGWPSWAPDGRRVAFARERADEADIYVVAFAGGRACLVAGGPGRKTSPKWSADGRAILFDRTHAGRTDVMRVQVGEACGEGGS